MSPPRAFSARLAIVSAVSRRRQSKQVIDQSTGTYPCSRIVRSVPGRRRP